MNKILQRYRKPILVYVLLILLVLVGLDSVAQKTDKLEFKLSQAQLGLMKLNLDSGGSKINLYTQFGNRYLDIYNEAGLIHHGILTDVDSISSLTINTITEKELETSASPLKTSLFHKNYSYSVTYLDSHEVINQKDVSVSILFTYHPDALILYCILHTDNEEVYTGYLNYKK